ncbi:hypothetical protein SD78_0010 [Bacillus badius]|nr:hypothetical protein SD78_0010 [Bacillus badius]
MKNTTKRICLIKVNRTALFLRCPVFFVENGQKLSFFYENV